MNQMNFGLGLITEFCECLFGWSRVKNGPVSNLLLSLQVKEF